MDYREFKQYLHKDRNKIIEFSERHRNIYFYGAGDVARKMITYMEEEGIAIVGIIVTKKNKTNSLDGIRIMELSNVNLSDDDGIILAVSEKLQNEIEQQLLEYGIKEKDIYRQRIFSYGNLITEDEFYDEDFTESQFFNDFTELDQIGLDNNTDKASNKHNYLNKYDFFLCGYKKMPIIVLELGVFKGASLDLWGTYFQTGQIYGVDIDQSCKKFEKDNKHVIITDLSDIENIKSLCELKPNIVIDDASHCWSHQIKALTILFNSIQPGGIYICEDLGTSFYRCKESNYADSSISGFRYCEAINRVMNGGVDELYDDEKPFKNQIVMIASQVDMISFIHGSCIIVKK